MALNTSLYDSIMNEYDHLRMERDYLIEKRKKEIYEKIPEYKELDRKIASVSIKAGIASLSGESTLDTLNEQIEDLKRQKNLLLIEAGFSINYLEPEYGCPFCKDTGFVGTEPCHCLKQKTLDYAYKQSGIRNIIKEENFDNLSHEYHTGEELTNFINAENCARDLVAHFDTEHKNILFMGQVGTGKSFLSNCIANEIIKEGYSVIYFSAVSLFETISSYKFRKDKYSSEDSVKDIYSCDLLVIDDLGSEIVNQFVCSELFTIVNERFLQKKSTVISTNLSMKEIAERYSSRVFSRIHLYYDTCVLTGNDIRVYKKRIENRK